MIVQAIALLDDLDKEINIYSMRVKVRKFIDLGLRTKLSILLRNGMAGISQRCPR